MKAAVIEAFGDESEIKTRSVPIPSLDGNEVLIRLDYAGIGSWDLFEREGGYARMLGLSASFPYVLGSEGCGRIVDAGKGVSRFKEGDVVAAAGFLNPKGGFYAEYVAMDEQLVTHIPSFYDTREASAVLGIGITAVRGLIDTLEIRKEEKVCILGASGGIGHIAAQIAHGAGTRVHAIAAGNDGVELLSNYGITKVCDGREKSIVRVLDEMDFKGFDKALILAGGELGDEVCRRMSPKGVVAYPSGVFPEPTGPGIVKKYNGDPDKSIIQRVVSIIEDYRIKPHICREFPLHETALAHSFIKGHHLGKAVLRIRSGS
jgi:NADPH:quinone reductase-like Zn-dependent oxidoreductase